MFDDVKNGLFNGEEYAVVGVKNIGLEYCFLALSFSFAPWASSASFSNSVLGCCDCAVNVGCCVCCCAWSSACIWIACCSWVGAVVSCGATVVSWGAADWFLDAAAYSCANSSRLISSPITFSNDFLAILSSSESSPFSV